jgi:hypothetical protein
MIDIETRADALIAMHVVAGLIGDASICYGNVIEQRFFDAGELPSPATAVKHLDRLLRNARRAMQSRPKRKQTNTTTRAFT